MLESSNSGVLTWKTSEMMARMNTLTVLMLQDKLMYVVEIMALWSGRLFNQTPEDALKYVVYTTGTGTDFKKPWRITLHGYPPVVPNPIDAL